MNDYNLLKEDSVPWS